MLGRERRGRRLGVFFFKEGNEGEKLARHF